MAESLQLFLVEDDDDFSYLMRKSLERAGHQVTVCHSGADALIVLGHSHFDLVLLDQKLPDMSGLDLLQALHREGVATPVLMVTGFGDEVLAAQVLRAGALDYVVKDRALTFLTDLPKRVHESITRFRLQQSNNLLIAALESARDGIMITDLQGSIQHVNQALERMFDYDRQELIGKNPRILRSTVHSSEVFAHLWRTILGRASWQGELVNKRKDGTLIDTSVTVSPIVNSQGQLTHFVGIFRDVSEHKRMERQLFQAQKMQSVGTLAGGVAHEFNNLLAGIQGYASLALREQNLSSTAHEFLDFIVQLSDRAANLTRQLLAFARKPALSRQITSMEQLLTTTASLVKHTLNLDVSIEAIDAMVDGEPLVALADANQLQQVLVNLALNARDASPKSAAPTPVVFRLRRRLLTTDLAAFPQNVPEGDYVVLEVEDRGSGMSPEVLQQALDPFFTTKDIGQGTGLGLPVAFGIILGHAGFLTIDTELGVGTCIRIYLPRMSKSTIFAVKATKGFNSAQILEPETPANLHILVIDDEEAVGDIIRRFLQIAGHRVTCVTSGADGVEAIKRGPAIDLAILDLMIPREVGLENIRNLRQKLPDLPILLCTGLVKADEAGMLLEQGNVSILRKPFRMNELWYAVNKTLGVRSGS